MRRRRQPEPITDLNQTGPKMATRLQRIDKPFSPSERADPDHQNPDNDRSENGKEDKWIPHDPERFRSGVAIGDSLILSV